MEGYRGGALGFKAASFHAIGANKRRYPPAPVLFFGRYRETATSANTKKAGLDTAALIAELDLAISVDCAYPIWRGQWENQSGSSSHPRATLKTILGIRRRFLLRQRTEGDWKGVIDLLQPKLT